MIIGFGYNIIKGRAEGLGEIISRLFADEGFTALSQFCNNLLANQINDPRDIYYKYSVARDQFNTAGFTELSAKCSLTLMDQITA